ncbi:uncharacterized protein LOC131293173 [Anopheles ziemanni]|uniref:uncharacterized protein LOC131264081 n=1 Tax=Anopheles coustani TaxID=139045 RepID=UPI0026595D55|nr:uncharacterized protein LOC131264081 [Anopheles coustani]XP_058177235.1 uncharacterized protein LOC131293173 [Anopheles ziemanni]
MATDQELITLAPNDWAHLRDLYQRDWPQYEVAYETVQNYIDWAHQLNHPPEVTFYTLPESWRKDGTVIIVSGTYIFIYTLDETLDTLRRTLLAFKWNQSYLVAMTYYRALVLEVYNTLRLQKVLDIPNMFYYLNRKKAAQFTVELPDGFTTGRIFPEHATLINDRWRFKSSNSEATIKRLLQLNYSMGLYDPQGQLVGWCLRGENGAVQMLDVETKRKGYGTIVLKAFAKYLAAKKLNTFACVVSLNEPSKALFLKLGFAEICEVGYLMNAVGST